MAFNYSVHPFTDLAILFSSQGAELFVIALGATLQAFVGSALLRFWIGDPLSQPSNSKLFGFIFIVGILVNLISASIGSFALSSFSPDYSEDSYWLNMVYWWLGDSLGVLLVTPFLLSILSVTKFDFKETKSFSLIPFATVFLFLSVLILTAFFIEFSNQSVRKSSVREMKALENGLYRELNNSLVQLQSLASFIQNTPDMNKTVFSEFVGSLTEAHPTIKAMSWNPMISGEELSVAEQELSDIYGRPIKIRGDQLNNNDPFVYVKLISPEQSNAKAIGFNVYSNPKRKETLDAAKELFQARATPIINLVQSSAKEPAYLMFLPVYRAGEGGKSTDRLLAGFATGVFLAERMIQRAFSLNDTHLFKYEIYEEGENISFASNTGITELSLSNHPDLSMLDFHLAGQLWHLNLVPDREIFALQQSRSYLLLYVLEVVIVVFVILLILMMHIRQSNLDRLVKEKTESLRLAVESAKQANRAKSRFLANMSHEIRTPMNAVVGFSRLAKDAEDLNQIKSYLDKVEVSSDILLNIVNDILDISKIESGKLVLSNEVLDMHKVLQRIETLFESQMSNKGLSWELVDDLPQDLFFRGDQIRIEQVLVNLCGNALKFTESGGVSVVARILKKSESTAKLSITVKDSGIGIAAEKQSQLFSVFTQADESTSRKYGGTGLGLAISKELSHLMQGSIEVESEVGHGSTFEFSFTLQVSDEMPLDDAHAELRDFSHLKVLVAEDNTVNQLVIKAVLENMGVKPVIVDDGAKAVDAVQEGNFDLVLMDCQMPVLDGYEATAKIRKIPSLKHLPIVALTADVDVESKQRAINVGMSDHLSKPVIVEQLVKCLQRL